MRACGWWLVCAMAASLWGAARAQMNNPWFELETRLTLNCDEGRTFMPNLMQSCTPLLSTNYRQVTVNGVTLMSLFSKNFNLWKAIWDWDPVAAAVNWWSDPNNGCAKDTLFRFCRRARVCEMVEERYGYYFRGGAQGQVAPNQPKEVESSKTTFCMLCPPQPCSAEEQSCPNGKVVLKPGLGFSEELNINGEPYATTSALCSKSCSAGYWLTCLNSNEKEKCSYLAPTSKMAADGADRDKGVARWIQQNRMAGNGVLPVAMQLKFGFLIGECYPCLYANGLSHYGEPLLLADSHLVKQGYLDFYCPGGEQAPVRCPQGQVSKIDSRTNSSGACDCMDGYYRVGSVCQPCPAGFKCTFGVQTPVVCPADTFSLAGAANCTQCNTDNGRCGPTQALSRCLSGFQDRDAYCVDCQNCRLPGITSGVPCQRASVVQVV
jgi:hypothetical protein